MCTLYIYSEDYDIVGEQNSRLSDVLRVAELPAVERRPITSCRLCMCAFMRVCVYVSVLAAI